MSECDDEDNLFCGTRTHRCAFDYYCANGQTCQFKSLLARGCGGVKLVNGYLCTGDGDCQSSRCKKGLLPTDWHCAAKLAKGRSCFFNNACQSNRCQTCTRRLWWHGPCIAWKCS